MYCIPMARSEAYRFGWLGSASDNGFTVGFGQFPNLRTQPEKLPSVDKKPGGFDHGKAAKAQGFVSEWKRGFGQLPRGSWPT